MPKAYGGMEVSNVALIAVTEELEKSSVPFELGNHVSNILYNCKGEQIDKYLWPCIRGEKTSAFGLSEPASGADPSMMQTTATPDGDYFVINGTKMFPTFADVADFVQLFARLPGTNGREGVTCFLVDTGTPGYRVARSIATIAGTEPCELVFEDCRVHKSQVLGEVGNGWALNQAWLGARRFQVGIRAHGKCAARAASCARWCATRPKTAISTPASSAIFSAKWKRCRRSLISAPGKPIKKWTCAPRRRT